ncbi:hypothetical protein KIPE111705_38750 [Kibdelosporangium persicum]|uniref:2'-5' RNA ligase n=1 Tax=Kibdelosporangium persicum TaxID=2698649 RepID=A0ABX2FBP8_9PSEU|nr:hypothetical protein [Kibdelosporangium persicum]NRN68796.1 hypothetical protein [Kibdelosporangium persicum]
MTLVVLDVVVVLPPELRRASLELGDRMVGRMAEHGHAAHFRLGQPFTSVGAGVCEPHVSVFMLAVAEDEIGEVVNATRRLAGTLPVLPAEGQEYRHNPFGAPELFFRKTAKWIDLQRAVIAEVEPLRQGRLRETDPAGLRLRDLIDDPRTDPGQRAQLRRFGYDEVTDDDGRDRFNPHVTLAWPVDPTFRVDLSGLPPARDFSGTLTELAVYGMSPYGTCTTLYGTAQLGAAVAVDDGA